MHVRPIEFCNVQRLMRQHPWAGRRLPFGPCRLSLLRRRPAWLTLDRAPEVAEVYVVREDLGCDLRPPPRSRRDGQATLSLAPTYLCFSVGDSIDSEAKSSFPVSL
jgi:hypothetical protein